MRRKNSKFFWTIFWIVILVGSIYAYQNNIISLKNIFNKSNFGFVSTLDVIENPENYLEKEITLNNVEICGYMAHEKKIGAKRADGTSTNIEFRYMRDIGYDYRFDLTGRIEYSDSVKQTGLIKVDEQGNPVEGTFYFNVSKAIAKDLRLNEYDVPWPCY